MQQVRPSTSPQPVIDPVGGRLLALHRPLRGVRAGLDPNLDERAGIDQQVDPLPGGQLPALVLDGDLFGAASELRLLAAGVKILDERPHAGRLAGLDVVRRLGRLALVLRSDLLLSRH